MTVGIAALLVGPALFVYGTKKVQLRLRAIGAGLAAYGVVSVALPVVFG